MSGSDGITGIEDEPYQGLYHGVAQTMLGREPDHMPDRFDLAEILRKTREDRGMTLAEVSEITRVREAYLEALEQAAYDILPPRAFAIGYVKAYAKALDLDEETLADMFKRDVSEPQTRLHAPSGASLEDVKPNYGRYIAAAAGLVGAIVIWNVVQHRPTGARTIEEQFEDVKWAGKVPLIRDGVLQLTRPAPAPRDQDIPAPYVTPGLEEGFAAIGKTGSSASDAPVAEVTTKAFNPRGAVYGAQPESSAVTIQATRGMVLTVRDAAGVVYFAHPLSAGEAYRLPSVEQQDLILDVSDFKAAEVYYNGEYAGTMDANRSPIGRVNARAAQMASALVARQPAAVQAATPLPPAPEAPVIVKKSDAPIPYGPAVKPAPVAAPVSAPSSAAPSSSAAAPASSSAAAPQ